LRNQTLGKTNSTFFAVSAKLFWFPIPRFGVSKDGDKVVQDGDKQLHAENGSMCLAPNSFQPIYLWRRACFGAYLNYFGSILVAT
jgi:hypothetical protein